MLHIFVVQTYARVAPAKHSPDLHTNTKGVPCDGANSTDKDHYSENSTSLVGQAVSKLRQSIVPMRL